MPAKKAAAAAAPVAAAANGMTRLTPARDLTLGGRGGAAANKKVFAPNLNAVRNKNTNVKTSKDFTQPRGGRARGGRGSAAGATRGRGGGGNSTLIQTTGVFSEGAGAVHLRKSTSAAGGGGGSSYARAGEELAVSRKRTGKDDKVQELRVQELLGGEIEESEEEPVSDIEMEQDKTDMDLKPVLLSEGLWSSKTLIKDEPADDVAMAQRLQAMHVSVQNCPEEPPAQYGRYPRNIAAFLEAQAAQLFIMQLPDVLPCVSDADEEPTERAAAANGAAEQPSSPAPPAVSSKHSVLKQLEEGQIGKILRYRSGRVKLLLGDTHFDLDMGLESGFLQELMSISSNREQRSGNMINLGPIQAKLKATPDWVHLFKQQDAAALQQRVAAATAYATTATASAAAAT
ncbi:CG5147 [Drosophila busckii]|uniref:CG5147 n=1 Tax=Drosophila busckii TaxID=30019 RepID=A0A0M3QWY8_DROBS|nr:CG5147 [Drosophila busckii]